MKRLRLCLHTCILGVGALAALPGLTATAPTPTPTPAQVEAFKQLPEAEQQRLLEGLQSGTRTVQDQPLAQPQPGGVAPAGTPTEAGATVPTEPGAVAPATPPTTPTPTPGPLDPDTGLPLFGYDLFAGVPSTFAPVTDIPVPTDYVVGPGDMVSVQLFGRDQASYSLVVNRDGALNFPQLGPITVAGLTFDAMRERLQARVAEQMIGVTASIGMGELRSIRIFVLGEAERPGSYTVSSLSTVTNALFASGGVKPIGSLRNIQLKRQGELIATLDLYDLLLRGDTSGDERLQPGDVIFIPPVGTRVGVSGAVLRAGMYELKGETTVGDLVQLAGGLGAKAYPRQARLSRIDEQRIRIQQDVDLRSPDGPGTRLQKGDVLDVSSVLDNVENVVTLLGHVQRPGPVEYRSGMRLSDLIPSIDALQPVADVNYVLIRRELLPNRRVVALSADLEAALRHRGGTEDVGLMPRDQVRVFSSGGERPELQTLIDELRLQATLDKAAPVVRVGGRVRAPGEYPLEPDMRVSDLLRAGGALAESAYSNGAEITRYAVVNGEYRQTDVIDVDLAAVRRGDPAADLPLAPYDFLSVREVSDWREQETVELKGEVRFPGVYPIRKGETLLSVLERAGGLTDRAYPNGAVFTRVKLRQREEQQIKQMVERLEADVAALSLQESQAPEGGGQADTTLAAGRGLLAELRNATPVGRLAMDLPRLLKAAPGSAGDLVLEADDVLMVPGPMQSITVVGEVQSPTSLLYDDELGRDDYINMSGGLTRRADAGRVYVVRANGQVSAGTAQRWFRNDRSELMPGDTIVVPADLERMRPLPLWTSVTSIIFNLAVAVAAVNSF